MIGKKFGRLTVVKQEGQDNFNNKCYECLCECGATKIISGASLRRGATQSCGCLHKERAAAYCARTKKTHGLSQTAEYTAWEGLKQRCLNPANKDYHKWGGRGITVCDEWINSFEQFLSDMGTRPDKHTLDRRDVNGPYSKDNCRWVTHKTQQRNKRSSRYIEHDNQTLCISEWAEILDVQISAVYRGLRAGKNLAEIKEYYKARVLLELTYNGKTQPLKAWATELGIPLRTIRNRLAVNNPIEKVLQNDH
jgi:hypothetical protein